jgi:hypothetical protein
MSEIYDQLASSSSLQANQKDQLMKYFEENLCVFMGDQLPFC